LLVVSLSRTQLVRKQSATKMVGRGGVAASEPSYMEGADGDDGDDDDDDEGEQQRQHKGVISPIPIEVIGSFLCRMLQLFLIIEVARVANLGRCFRRVYDIDSAYEVSRIRGY
jgi:hypothetical protein